MYWFSVTTSLGPLISSKHILHNKTSCT